MNDPKIVFGRDCARLLRQLQLPAESQDVVFKTSVEKKKSHPCTKSGISWISMPHSIPLLRPNPADPVPSYRLPHLIHTYSHLPTRAISHDDASMAYYSPAPIGCNLTEGFERRIEREDEEEHLDGLVESLEWLITRGRKGERKGGIITWRGMLTR